MFLCACVRACALMRVCQRETGSLVVFTQSFTDLSGKSKASVSTPLVNAAPPPPLNCRARFHSCVHSQVYRRLSHGVYWGVLRCLVSSLMCHCSGSMRVGRANTISLRLTRSTLKQKESGISRHGVSDSHLQWEAKQNM